MQWIDENGRFLGKVNIVDLFTTSVVVLGVLGVFLVQSGLHVTSGQVVEGEADIFVDVQISDLKSLDPNLFKAGEKTDITIRNQPRGSVSIVEAHSQPVQVTVLDSKGQVKGVGDYSEPNGHDFFVTLKDHAKITQNGYVAAGVKVKVGLPIELEGFKYRAYGRIINVREAK